MQNLQFFSTEVAIIKLADEMLISFVRPALKILQLLKALVKITKTIIKNIIKLERFAQCKYKHF